MVAIFYFPINIGLRLSSQLTNSYFSEGWLKTANQIHDKVMNQPRFWTLLILLWYSFQLLITIKLLHNKSYFFSMFFKLQDHNLWKLYHELYSHIFDVQIPYIIIHHIYTTMYVYVYILPFIIYIYIYIYVHIYIYTHIHIYTYTSIHIYIFTYIYIYTYLQLDDLTSRSRQVPRVDCLSEDGFQLALRYVARRVRSSGDEFFWRWEKYIYIYICI